MHKTLIIKRKVCILPINRPTKNMLMDAVDANPLETLLTKFNIHKKEKKKKKEFFQKKSRNKKWLRKSGMRRCLKLLRKRAPASKAFLRKDAN